MTTRKPIHSTYSECTAKQYRSIGTQNSTYSVGFDLLNSNFFDREYTCVIDFGCGAGRGMELLWQHGVPLAIGVDRDRQMLKTAREILPNYFRLVAADTLLPFPAELFDGAICTNVLIEAHNLSDLETIVDEVYRSLKPNAPFFIMTTNPSACGRSYRNFELSYVPETTSPRKARCKIKTPTGSFEVIDTLWEENDYVSVLSSVNFDIISIDYPLEDEASDSRPQESLIAPFIAIMCVKR